MRFRVVLLLLCEYTYIYMRKAFSIDPQTYTEESGTDEKSK